jgi:YesN/AraC family two-component response regulator
MMPEMDGFQLVKKIKSRSEYSGMPIIVLSARSEQTNISLLADGYLVKPFEEAELLMTVRKLMERQLISPEQEQTSENSREGDELCQIDVQDLEWLRQMEKITIESISNPTFTADTLAGAIFMGRTAFFQEVKRLTGMTPNQYIREVRLLEARWLLQHRVYSNFSSVVSAIGMKSESYVSLLFRQRFGVSPMTYFQHTDKSY